MDKEKLDKALTLRMMLDTNLNALSRASERRTKFRGNNGVD